MKKLSTVQKISKVLKILSQIIFICAIIGCATCLIASFVVGFYGKDPNFIRAFTEAGVEFNYNVTLCSCICATVACAFEIALYVYVVRFYKHELEIGTPFNLQTVKEMRRLGILHLVLPISAAVVMAIIIACFRINMEMQNVADITMGIVYLIVSYVLEYGAEVQRQKAEIENKLNEQNEQLSESTEN